MSHSFYSKLRGAGIRRMRARRRRRMVEAINASPEAIRRRQELAHELDCQRRTTMLACVSVNGAHPW